MAYYEAFYGRRYKSHIRWFEFSEAGYIGPHLDNQAMEMLKVIQERFKMAKRRQKSYTDVWRRELALEKDIVASQR